MSILQLPRGDPMERERAVVSNSTGVQVGDDNLQVFFADPRKRKWFVIIAVCTVLVLVGVIVLINRTIARPDLELSAFAVQKPSKVAADSVNVATGEVTPGKEVDATAIDVTLKNNGTAPALLTAVIVKVKHADTLQDCRMMGGEARISAAYTIRLPEPVSGEDVPSVPFEMRKDIRFEVRGGTVDRFALTIGPSLQAASNSTPWLIVGDVELVRDDGKVLPVGTAAVVTEAGEGLTNLSTAPVEEMECIAENARKIDEVFEIPAVRTGELDELRSRYSKLSKASKAGSREACGGQVEAAVSKVCALLGGDVFQVSVDLATPPTSGVTGMVLRMRDESGAFAYEWLFNYKKDRSGKLGWQFDSRGYAMMYPEVEKSRTGGTRLVLTTMPSVDMLLADKALLTAERTSLPGTAAVAYPETLVIPKVT
ncbi:hypothetical protein M8C13_06960 [Crossiella sp. SN42]|uniref:hypothetical protein n=1 Tax=Crossiella sp. SN42 TaxID=2944808 RepID=UPI00207CC3C2|nr:hypothetical protein [Crossiella sp. SN42]MCO1575496.1 hypothetical protein [Crossiella sp. SN42]